MLVPSGTIGGVYIINILSRQYMFFSLLPSALGRRHSYSSVMAMQDTAYNVYQFQDYQSEVRKYTRVNHSYFSFPH